MNAMLSTLSTEVDKEKKYKLEIVCIPLVPTTELNVDSSSTCTSHEKDYRNKQDKSNSCENTNSFLSLTGKNAKVTQVSKIPCLIYFPFFNSRVGMINNRNQSRALM